MEMKVNAQRIKQSREERGWSQEHLASITGLSARTIQRIETTGVASAESKMALASALEIDIGALADSPQAPAAVQGNAAPANPQPRRRFYRHCFAHNLLLYILICGSFLIADVSRHGNLTWSKWPILAWGLGLLYIAILRRRPRHT